MKKKKLFIKKTSKSYETDAFNNNTYAYFFRYNDPSSHGYMATMTEEGFYLLKEVLELSCEVVYSEV